MRRRHPRPAAAALVLGGAMLLSGCSGPEPATLVLLNGSIHTVDSSLPDARAIVITGNTITAVCKTDSWAKRYVGDGTRVIDLEGKFVLPGLIDARVHFAEAGARLMDADLTAVSDEAGLRAEIKRAVDLLDDGDWVQGGGWGDAGAAKDGPPEAAKAPWRPNRAMIDDLTPRHPCFVGRRDGAEWLANSQALRAAGLEERRRRGLEIGRDGRPTGIVFKPSPAYDALAKVVPPKSALRLLDENRAALKALREAGITEIHDVSTPEQEKRFIELERNGELTCRVWLRPDLKRGPEMLAAGYTMGLHPATKQKSFMLRYGALQGCVDGRLEGHEALLFEPYSDRPDTSGRWREHASSDPALKEGDLDKLAGLIRTGLQAGFAPNISAGGDRAVAETLDLFERLRKETGKDLHGFRMIRAQVVRPQDVKRFKPQGLIAEVHPSHLAEDMPWLEERLGPERCQEAYAFKSLLDAGVRLAFGSDWPGPGGVFYRIRPQDLIYTAITRKNPSGPPSRSWHPEQRISVKDAIKAYTINAAFAAFEDDVRGCIKVGNLADFTVFDRNLLDMPVNAIPKVEVTHTIVDGKVVFARR